MSKETLIDYLNQLIRFIREQKGLLYPQRYGICFYLIRVRPIDPLFQELVEHRLALHTDARENGNGCVTNYIWNRDDEGDKQRIQWLQDWIVELNAVPKFTEEQNRVYMENTSPAPCNTPVNTEEISCGEQMLREKLFINEAGNLTLTTGEGEGDSAPIVLTGIVPTYPTDCDVIQAAIEQVKQAHKCKQLPMTPEILQNLIFEFEGQSRSRVFREGICYYTPGEYMAALKERLVQKGHEPDQYCWSLNRAGNELRLEFLKEWWIELKTDKVNQLEK